MTNTNTNTNKNNANITYLTTNEWLKTIAGFSGERLAQEREILGECYISSTPEIKNKNGYFYRIHGTYDAIRLSAPYWGNPDGRGLVLCRRTEIKKNYFSERRAYGRKCATIAKATGLPWAVVSAFGPEAAGAVRKLKNVNLFPEVVHELSCGINRRKYAIQAIAEAALMHGFINEVEYKKLDEKLSLMGQKYSRAVADWLVYAK